MTVAPCGTSSMIDLGPRLRLELREVLGLDEDAVGPDLELPPGGLDVEVGDAQEHRAGHARRPGPNGERDDRLVVPLAPDLR